MSNNNESSNFFDTRTIAAIALVFVTWMGWQYYMQQKYPQMFTKKAAVTEAVNGAQKTEGGVQSPKTGTASAPAAVSVAVSGAVPSVGAAAPSETLTEYKSPNLEFQMSSQGMGLRRIRLLKYMNRKNETVEFSMEKPPFSYESRLLNSETPIPFSVEKVGDNGWKGVAKIGGATITKTVMIDPSTYKLDVDIVVSGDPKFAGLTTLLSDNIEPQKSGSFLSRSQLDRQEAFVDSVDSHNNHVYFSSDVVDKTWNNGRVMALGSPYFTQALVDHSPMMPNVKLHADPSGHTAVIAILYNAANHSGDFKVQYTGFVGPKSLDLLKAADEQLIPVVDFGFFNTIARYILAMLKWFYSIIGNWGVAIVLLTLVIRLIVLPFNIMSYRSMKAMQVLQPQLKALREKYKDDSQRQNQEVMALMRTHKVNPAGGCLPIVLQLPFFWAFYQVLGHSIELYQAPLGLWINDLSLKDPFYILPALMGVTMFAQQKITPNPTMDPTQAKLMQFMPIMFSFFMISLPSGLTLYLWVSSLFAVVQQFYFMKSHNPLVERKTV